MTSDYHSYSGARDEVEAVTVGNLRTLEVRNEKPPTQSAEVDEDDLSSIDENYDVDSLASSIGDQLTWRGRMQVVLHSLPFHIIIVSLVILDVFIVLFELLLDVNAFGNIVCPDGNFLEQAEFCHFHEDSRNMCASPPKLFLEGIFLPSEFEQEECVCGLRGGRQICIPRTEDEQLYADPAVILHGLSLFILTIFVIEVLLKMIAFRLKYFTHKFEVFDGIIVFMSWMLDFASLIEEEAFQAASLLILLRLWRILRVINGSVLSSVTQANAELHKARVEAKNIIHAFHKAQEKIKTVQNERDSFRSKLEQATKIKDS